MEALLALRLSTAHVRQQKICPRPHIACTSIVLTELTFLSVLILVHQFSQGCYIINCLRRIHIVMSFAFY